MVEIKNGDKFGQWTVIDSMGARVHRDKVLCRCSCGTEKLILANALICGKNKMCVKCNHAKNLHKPISTSEVYKNNKNLAKRWRGMVRRCEKPNERQIKAYRDKGIKVCEEWRKSPEAFILWSLDHGYSIELSLDRIDSDKDYCPENCRWVNLSVQNTNRKMRHLMVCVDGRMIGVGDAARELGVCEETIRRWHKKGRV